VPELWLNGRLSDKEELDSWTAALCDPSRLTLWGGVIFKFFHDPTLQPPGEWAIAPAIWEGERIEGMFKMHGVRT